MAKYKIVIHVDGNRIDHIKKACIVAFGQDISHQVTKIETQQSRADRLSDAEGWISDAKGVVSDLKGELEEWKSNMPESFQNGDKASELDDAISALEELESHLDNASFEVSFPSMM